MNCDLAVLFTLIDESQWYSYLKEKRGVLRQWQRTVLGAIREELNRGLICRSRQRSEYQGNLRDLLIRTEIN